MATVIDLYSRRVLGYAMGEHHDAGLVVAALNMAAVTRGGDAAGGIFHSDRGSEYTSADFARACARWNVRQSMGRVGSCFDNGVAEAAFSTIKSSTSTAASSAPHRGPHQDRHLDHRLLQPPSAALHLRRPHTYRLRTINGSGTGGPGRITESSTISGD